MRKHRANRLAKLIISLDKQIDDFYREYEDDSDSENNSSTNGYFPARPSQDEVVWLESRRNARDNYVHILVQEVLKSNAPAIQPFFDEKKAEAHYNTLGPGDHAWSEKAGFMEGCRIGHAEAVKQCAEISEQEKLKYEARIAALEKQLEDARFQWDSTQAELDLKYARIAELETANANCISLLLHESRMKALEEQLESERLASGKLVETLERIERSTVAIDAAAAFEGMKIWARQTLKAFRERKY